MYTSIDTREYVSGPPFGWERSRTPPDFKIIRENPYISTDLIKSTEHFNPTMSKSMGLLLLLIVILTVAFMYASTS